MKLGAAAAASPSISRSTEAAPPVAPVALAPRVKLEGSCTASVSSTTAPRLPSVSRSSATSALTLLERVLELRDNRLEFAQAERDVMLGKLVSYAVAKPFPEPSHELFRRLQGSSSIDEVIAALEKGIVGGPHPVVVAGEQQADAFAVRARADLLEHELRETMKCVSQLEESEKTASALVRSLKEHVAQLENRNNSLQDLHQSTNLERDSWSTERIRLDATIHDKERIIASMTGDYHRDAGNRQLVLGRCYELTVQVRQLSDAVAIGNTSAHQLLKRQLADKENEIRRLLRTIRMSPVVSEFQRRSPFMVVAAMLVSSSSGHGRQASTGSTTVSSTSTPPASSQVTSSAPTQVPPGSIADLASANASVSSSALAEDLEGADSSGVEGSPTSKQTEAASTLASLSRATKSVVIRALPPGKHSAWGPSDSYSDGGDSTGGSSAATPPNLSNKLVESSDSSGDESTLADSSKPKSQASSWLDLPPVSSKTPPPARSPVRSATSMSKSSSAIKAKAVVPARSAKDASKPKLASRAKATAAIRPAKDGSKPKSASKPSAGKAKLAASDTKARAKSDGGVPPHHVDVKVLVARAAASARLDYRESGPMKRLRELPFFHKGSKRCWEKIMSSCAVSVTMEKTADGERIKSTPCSIAGLAAFMDVDDSCNGVRSTVTSVHCSCRRKL
ncbi:unnamed protein product [Phytophthora fragariaefolia]|uniref:Unnamed protein product n=1 Tax=Phytophthora fragariaefolia TaxID=1490495 RepID=A0A9W6Y1T2_9STRA|nr:unnamed protein product [Phytophthora fragariaefolia]